MSFNLVKISTSSIFLVLRLLCRTVLKSVCCKTWTPKTRRADASELKETLTMRKTTPEEWAGQAECSAPPSRLSYWYERKFVVIRHILRLRKWRSKNFASEHGWTFCIMCIPLYLCSNLYNLYINLKLDQTVQFLLFSWFVLARNFGLNLVYNTNIFIASFGLLTSLFALCWIKKRHSTMNDTVFIIIVVKIHTSWLKMLKVTKKPMLDKNN